MTDVRRVIFKFDDGYTGSGYVDLDEATQGTHEDEEAYSFTVTTHPPEELSMLERNMRHVLWEMDNPMFPVRNPDAES